ncbi:MAG: hypothetical protein U5J82_03320 [Desulfobacterales bacterium]|nr:hypothetical protein [Desulfobacterales bacterium]
MHPGRNPFAPAAAEGQLKPDAPHEIRVLLHRCMDVAVSHFAADGLGVVVSGHQDLAGLAAQLQRQVSPHGHLVVGAEDGVDGAVGLQQAHGGAHGVGGVPEGAFTGRQINPLTDPQALEQAGPEVLGADRAADAVQQNHPPLAPQPLPHVGADQRRAALVVGPHIRDFDPLRCQRLGIQRVVDVDDHHALAYGLGAHRHQLAGVCRCDDDGPVAPGNEVFDDADLVGDMGGPDQAENFEVDAPFLGIAPDPGLHLVTIRVGERFQHQRHFPGIGGAGRRRARREQDRPQAKARHAPAEKVRKNQGHSVAGLGCAGGRGRRQEDLRSKKSGSGAMASGTKPPAAFGHGPPGIRGTAI